MLKKRIHNTLMNCEESLPDRKSPSLRYTLQDIKVCVSTSDVLLLVISAAYWWNYLVYQWKRTSWWTFRFDFYYMWPRNQGEYWSNLRGPRFEPYNRKFCIKYDKMLLFHGKMFPLMVKCFPLMVNSFTSLVKSFLPW